MDGRIVTDGPLYTGTNLEDFVLRQSLVDEKG